MFDYVKKPVRSAAILTDAYVAGTTIDTKGEYNQMVVLWDFTVGSLTTGELKVEFSPDNSTFYQETFSAVLGGTSTETLGEHQVGATGKRRILIPLADRFVKISVKGTGTVTNSSCTVDVILARI